MTERTITEAISVADQPTEADLEGLKGRGFAGVVNLRHDGEPDQPLGPEAEGQRAKALGLDYLHCPTSGNELTEEGVDRVVRFLDSHPEGKVLVHCRKGGRAAAVVLLHQAMKHGWGPGEAREQGEAIGLHVDPKLGGLVDQFLAARGGRPS